MIPIIVISAISYYIASNDIREGIIDAQALYVNAIDGQLEQYNEEREADARVIATTRDVYQSLNILKDENWDTSSSIWHDRKETIVEVLGGVVEDAYNYDLVIIAAPNGEIVYFNQEEHTGSSLADRDYFQGAARGDTTWSELFYSDIVNNNVILVAQPILSSGDHGEVVGVLGLGFPGEHLDQMVHMGIDELGETANAYVIDQSGLLLTNALHGNLQQGAALNSRIDTRAVEIANAGIRVNDINHGGQEEYRNYMGNRVLGSIEVFPLGDMLAALVIEIDSAEAFAGVMALRNMIIIVGLIAIVLGSIAAYLISRNISVPVGYLVKAIDTAAKGDFTTEATVTTGDEIGVMGKAFNEMLSDLKDMIGNILGNVDNVTKSSQEMSAAAQQTSAAVEEVASSTNQFSGTVQSVSSTSQSIAQLAGQVEESSDKGGKQIKDTVEGIREVNSIMDEMMTAMSALDKQSEEIGKIVELITGITDQTNLLALNAAIEAARAGEHGRGFAVVAEEVRKLAEQSRKAAEEITGLIGEIRKSTDNAVKRSEHGQESIGEGTAEAERSGEMFGEIRKLIERLTSEIGEVASASEELASGGQQIAASTQQQSASVQQIASSSAHVAEIADDLKERMNRFKVS